VLITDINGFVSSHVTMQTLNKDKYEIRGSIKNKVNNEEITEIFGEKLKDMEVVNLELLDDQSVQEAIKGILRNRLH
jgi:nucleoside-diphosphate-sugar epimerase